MKENATEKLLVSARRPFARIGLLLTSLPLVYHIDVTAVPQLERCYFFPMNVSCSCKYGYIGCAR